MSKVDPYISVIIPTYNRAGYIASAIDSVLSQRSTWPLEIIVVDDGSTDNSEAIISKYKDRLSYYKLPHSGRPAIPRNFGISKAKGDLIAFQDSDDRWSKNKLASQVPMFEDRSVSLCYGNAGFMDEHGKISKSLVIELEHLSAGKSFGGLIKENVISTLTVIARKSAIVKAGGFNESPRLTAVEDYHLWLRMVSLGKFAYTDKVIAYYRKHGQNISPSSQLESLKNLINLNKILLKELPSHSQEIKARLSQLYKDYSRLSSFPTKQMYIAKYKLAGAKGE